MLRLFAAGCALLLVGSAAAGEEGRCQSVAEFARFIMDGRQLGFSILEMKNMMPEEPEPGLSRAFLIEAYETPRTDGDRDEVVTEFENKAYLNCLKGASS